MNLPGREGGDDRAGRVHTLGLLEVLDRDGLARSSVRVTQWPLRIGRALDNDLVLSDPHVAAYHATIDATGEHIALVAAPTRNGLVLGRQRLRGGQAVELATAGEPAEITIGRTHLRLRLPGHALAPELATVSDRSLLRHQGPVAMAALVLLCGTLFATWLGTDPGNDARALGAALLSLLVGGALWCAMWALLTKTFTRQARFGWHLRVFVFASVALMAVGAVLPLAAFALSWPWLSGYEFVAVVGVLAAALYFHVLAIEPTRRFALKGAALTCAAVGIALTLWFNRQRNDQFSDELYMSHLYPPAWRLARPVDPAAFVAGLATLKPTLDRKSKEPGSGDDGPRSDEP
ncbi:MAG: FHA domain-containing protein [Pseudomonadota bacterium]|nr:FHA domain-containing protein [Pseudomonadota bacterium]